jgi:glycosyltransferase involved in cell wall biosynthesis
MLSGPDQQGAAVLDPAKHQPRVSVVIPCLNEAETIRIVVEKAWQGLNAAGAAGEVVVADNGSTDGSQQLATEAGARVVPVAERGYGSALIGGIEAAHGEYVIMGDADDTYDFSRISAFVEALERGDDLVMGNRFAGGIAPGAMPWKNRLVGNPALTFVGRLLFRSPVRDFHCGLRAFRRDAILGLGLASSGMEFASEMVIRASLAGLRVSEVPTTLSHGPAGREPHLRPWRDGWRHLRLLLLYSPRWLFLYPGIALGLAGAAVMLALVPGAITIGGTRFDVHTMLYGGAALMLGYQTVLFAVFARIFGMTQGFLPESARMRRLLDVVTLETGIAVGLVLAALGLAGSIWAVVHWSNRSFGALDYAHTLRIVIPSVVALVLGVQTIVSSFFLSFLGLADRGAR